MNSFIKFSLSMSIAYAMTDGSDEIWMVCDGGAGFRIGHTHSSKTLFCVLLFWHSFFLFWGIFKIMWERGKISVVTRFIWIVAFPFVFMFKDIKFSFFDFCLNNKTNTSGKVMSRP